MEEIENIQNKSQVLSGRDDIQKSNKQTKTGTLTQSLLGQLWGAMGANERDQERSGGGDTQGSIVETGYLRGSPRPCQG